MNTQVTVTLPTSVLIDAAEALRAVAKDNLKMSVQTDDHRLARLLRMRAFEHQARARAIYKALNITNS